MRPARHPTNEPHLPAPGATPFLLGILAGFVLLALVLLAIDSLRERTGPDVAAASDPVVATAGDIACGAGSVEQPCKQTETSDLLMQIDPDAVLPLGDLQYEEGAYLDYLNFYDSSWGRKKPVTRPALGNHEYGTPGASDTFDYFNGIGMFSGPAGDRDKGYYSFDLGAWHLVALNSNCAKMGGCAAGSAQEQWLRQDLAATDKRCTIAYWHHPRWTSDTRAFDTVELDPLVQALYDHGVELLLVGHSHFYERFAPQGPNQQFEPGRGVRQIIVGTGGRDVNGFGEIEPNSEVRNGETFGVLKLTLHETSYDWQFVPIAGQTFSDAGTDFCHGTSPDTNAPTAPTALTASAPSSHQVDLAWSPSSDDTGVAGYQIFRDGAQIATSPVPAYTDATARPETAYRYEVAAYDPTRNTSDLSNTASVTTPAATAVLTFTPAADAYLRAGSPDSNAGSATTLQVDGSPVKDSLIRFAVSDVGARAVVSATLRLYATDASKKGGEIYRLADTGWSEGSVTWATAPPAEPGVVASLGAVTAGVWHEIDVTSLVAGDGPVGLRVASTTSDGADYSSKEGAFSPQLVVTVSDAGSDDLSPPTTPADLVATAVSDRQVDLTWTASADDTAIAGYRVLRDGAEIATAPGATYSDATALPETTYAYRVVAFDQAGNASAPSNVATITTLPSASVQLTFWPTDDAYIRTSSPSSTSGSQPGLQVDGSPQKDVLLKFSVTGVGAGQVVSAKLRLYSIDGSRAGGEFGAATDSNWTESTVTWNNAPPAGAPFASLGRVAVGTWYEVDVTPLITGDGTFSLRVASSSSDGADYASSEGAAGFGPELHVVVSNAP